MPEKKTLSTITSLIADVDSITIHTEYKEAAELPNTIDAILAEAVGSLDGVSYIEGELVIEMKNYLSQINYKINDEGELVLYASTADIDYYSIDSNGNLVWEP